VLQHRAVDGHIEVTLASALPRLAADWDELAHRRALLLALKSLSSKTAMKLARDGVQLFGGMGFSDEGPVGPYLKHAMVLAARYGGDAHSRRLYAGLAPDLMA
jgi:alkylation response protein AidB-like acyl-CoA dehydrogenase